MDVAGVRVVPGLEAAGRPGEVLQAAGGRPPHRAALNLGLQLQTKAILRFAKISQSRRSGEGSY